MKIRMITLVLLVSPFLLFAQIKPNDSKHSFVGTAACGMCHKTEKQGEQLGIWQKSKHAKAFETLKSDKANEIAKGLGHTTPAVETEECLACHAPEHSIDKSRLGEKFSIEDGVQCETCHGPGSDYKSLKVMKNKDEAVANGLVVITDMETFCTQCHNEKSPTFVKRDVSEMWKEIKHDIPAK